MDTLSTATFIKLVALVSFSTVGLAVFVAVFAKAYGNFPHRPDETKTFTKHALPRTHLFCFRYFDKHRPALKKRARLKNNIRRAGI